MKIQSTELLIEVISKVTYIGSSGMVGYTQQGKLLQKLSGKGIGP
jgi:hypothetical protein